MSINKLDAELAKRFLAWNSKCRDEIPNWDRYLFELINIMKDTIKVADMGIYHDRLEKENKQQIQGGTG